MAARSEAAAWRLGVSACLLGEPVRWDGGQKRDRALIAAASRGIVWVPVCPELEAGMGVPREPVRLVGDPERPRMLGRTSGTDWTGRMAAWIRRRVGALAAEDLRGFVFKSGSPSCGVFQVGIYSEPGTRAGLGSGLFARAFRERFPLVPVEEESRLRDEGLREHFWEQVAAYDRLRRFLDGPRGRAAWVAFHTAEKLLLMAHAPEAYRELGRRVAAVARTPAAEFARAYAAGFMAALARPATPAKHANVLQHVLGYFRRELDEGDRGELRAAIEAYRVGIAPRRAPLALIRRHLRRHPHEWLAVQTYLLPRPGAFQASARQTPPPAD